MPNRQEIVGLQYLRGLAALAVVVGHVKGTAGQAKYFDAGLLGNFLDAGQIGADLFFVISGFIITVVSLEGRDAAPTITRRDFFARRFARIVPLMWIAILSYAALRLTGRGAVQWDRYLNALLLLPHGELLPQTIWTLRQELLFYLLFAAAMLGRVRRLWLLGAWGTLSLMLWLAMNVALSAGWATPEQLTTPGFSLLRVLFHTASLEFLAGMAIALAWLRVGRPGGARAAINPFWMLAAATMLAVAVFGALSGTWLASLQLPAMIGLLGATVWLGVRLECPAGRVRSAGLLLGNASYSIYLFHPHAISPIAAIWSKLAPATPFWIVVTAISVAAIIAGILTHLLLEKPLVRFARRWFEQPSPVPIAPGTPH